MKIYLVKHGYYEYGGTFSSPWTVDVIKAFIDESKAKQYAENRKQKLPEKGWGSDDTYYVEEMKVEE